MEMTGEQRIPAPRQQVWEALNDPEVLRRCIPGCQELVKESDTEMTAIALVKVGPISARFQGRVTLSDMDPPNGYRITGEGQGGVAGHARGGAVVRLAEDGGETVLAYEVSAQIGGKLAQLGGRMIDATARTMAGAFFKQFAQEVTAPAGGAAAGKAPQATAGQQSAPPRPALATASAGPEMAPTGRWLWLLAGIVLGAIALLTGEAASEDRIGLAHVVLAALAGFVAARLPGAQRRI
ncbi:SRPBCC family protein [Novosphingobium malaysiense]|uniref:Carbon monoxide dehydrogenase n=1 Tax=Novosphingobium malaysiense TaxID=1348853 RepID=A0A0B1ZLV6_9SPHN|nr:carbon monoxide dehydrogenase subunit G [Novosphingobium malaysiense]KHK90324.1 hypothetical protein LK12_17070 [Novosphingobium malaysiense]